MYTVIEIQTNEDNASGTLVTSFEKLEQAWAKYHAVLSAAAISTLPVHTAVLLTNAGTVLASESYHHDVSA